MVIFINTLSLGRGEIRIVKNKRKERVMDMCEKVILFDLQLEPTSSLRFLPAFFFPLSTLRQK